jgi:hypothetical protein
MKLSGNLEVGAFFSAALTFLVFLTAINNEFVALDDFAYIVNNTQIATLDWNTFVWAFSSFHEGNWLPISMLSLAVDRFVWGLNPIGDHLTNIAIHSYTVFCSCFLFSLMLRAASSLQHQGHGDNSVAQSQNGKPVGLSERAVATCSIAGALFFGLHPLRVESVVWASERKDC